ncbi:MAG: type II CRISPR RNA-guided endonuclease Cas9 [Agathobacter sp.]|nr:type II CRISPR RNA-guided endonuclease Cas9 [Agathobacter sp.]
MEKEYYLGLDIGTGSVGWAVTTPNYEIIRSHGKSMWGVRLFESAKTAEERRIARTSRRRLARRSWRIELLQAIFCSEIDKIDNGFFHRMKESQYLPEDKRNLEGIIPSLPYTLFVDKKYTDKDYHKQFPTIYHLKKYLMETEETPDIRLVYLAIHHIIKHRGHFLFHGNFDSIRDFNNLFEQFYESISNEELDFSISLSKDEIDLIEDILKDKNLTRSTKKSKLQKELHANTLCEKAILALLCGCTVKLSDIFGNSELDDVERPKICFTEASYEDNASIYETELGEFYYIIAQAKAIYDWTILVDILGEKDSLSSSKVSLYNKHKKDLKYLKKIVKTYLTQEDYKNIFVKTSDRLSNYPAYIGMTKVNGKKVTIQGKQCSKDDFYLFLKKNVVSKIEEEKILYLVEELNKGSFLPKLVTKENSVLPNQIHLYELNVILDNLEDKLPVIKENREKIEQIFSFRIPYYVGPLNGIRKNGVSSNWAVRNSNEKIYPWNFEEVINIEESAERFIRRMTNKCTYLVHEDVLPKNSILYSKFVVLNELNNLRLNGEPISIELKQRIYEELFQRTRKVTQKKLKDYLVRNGIAERNVDITGIDGDFKGSLIAYHDFKEKLTGVDLSQDEKENIILNITLFGEDKKLLKQRLKKLYPRLTDKQLTELSKLSYAGWGRFSYKFLSRITAPSPDSGEVWTIIQALWETNDNLMQILSSKYLFEKEIERENGVLETEEISYKLVDELYVSPSVKRQIWQTLIIVKEICKIMGNPPLRIFVEMSREKLENKRTTSRRNYLIDLYKNCTFEEKEWIKELEVIDESSLRGDKLYLYYTQKGRCMYSGEPIELEDLWDNRKYDIDHIYPQSKIMDDSIDNRVLVKKELNSEKSDTYPIKPEIRNSMKSFWNSLLDGGFISKKKFERLTRSTEFEANELAGFIDRQLVETRQGTKAVASILKQTLPNSEIVYTKAKIVSKFRDDFDFIKVREMNDLHHAKDAYLNIVVGNTYFVKFTKNASWFIHNNPGRSYNLQKMFTSSKVESNGEIAWISGENGTIKTVRNTMNKNNILVTRRSYEVTGALFDLQILKKGKGQVSIKGSNDRLSDISKYGGYNKATGTYFVLVESKDKKGNKIRTIEYVPLYLKDKMEQDSESAKNILIERGLIDPIILIHKIKIDSLFKVDGFYMWLSGRTGNQLVFKGANQLILSDYYQTILKKVIKFYNRRLENKNYMISEKDNLTHEALLNLYDCFIDKLSNAIYSKRLGLQAITLQEKKENFIKLSIENKCLVLYEVLHLFQCQSVAANLSQIGGPGHAGILVLNNNITKANKISIINQSPTGIYEQEIDLKSV